MSDEYCTVVYRITGKEAFDEWWRGIHPLFLNKEGPVKVVAVSMCDAIAELDELKERLGEEA